MRGDSYQLQGQEGGYILAGGNDWASTAGVNPDGSPVKCRWIQVINDAVIIDFVSNVTGNVTSFEAATIPAGIGIGGETTSFLVLSGLVIGYTM